MRAVDPFESHVEAYDAWYDSREGSDVFRLEVDCLAPLVASCLSPRVEVGVGTGRFAQALGVEVGVDRARNPLVFARERGVHVVRADAHHLPFADHRVGAVVFIMTLCFVASPRAALEEARRVLRPDGRLVVGTVDLDSAWGEAYARAAREGHRFYRHAHLRTAEELGAMLASAGWEVLAWRSALREPPGTPSRSPARDGLVHGSGFVALVAKDASVTPRVGDLDGE